jgi:hypothetical protein
MAIDQYGGSRMTFYLIFLGGTGMRIADAVTFLTAAGMFADCDKIQLLLADSDISHLQKTVALLQDYRQVHEIEGINDSGLFAAELDIKKWEIAPFSDSTTITKRDITAILETPPGAGESGSCKKSATKTEKKDADAARLLMNSMFGENITKIQITNGFYGNASLAATFFAVATQFCEITGANITSDFVQFRNSVLADVDAAEQKSVKLMIVGSLYGATGAAGIACLGRYFRMQAKNCQQAEKLEIGCLLQLPYFDIMGNEGGNLGVFDQVALEMLSFYQKTLFRSNDKIYNAVYISGSSGLDVGEILA